MRLKVYEYVNCGTCRKAAKFLKENGVEFSTVPIREKPPTVAELKRMLTNYQGNLRKLFNTSGQDYKSLDMKSKLPQMSEEDALDLLSRNGNLVKRPFVLSEQEGIVGFEEEAWKRFIGR